MGDDHHLIVEHATDALSWHTSWGAFRYVSPGFTQLTGYREHELLGRLPNDLFHPEDAERVILTHAGLANGHDTFRVSYRARRADNTYLWVESTGRRVSAGPTHRGGIAVVTRDIEIRRSLMESLEYEQRIHQELRQLTDQQQHFVTSIAHRARTPMTSVLGFAQTLHASGDRMSGDRRRQLTERLAVNAQRLADVIEDVTDLDRLARRSGTVLDGHAHVATVVTRALRQLSDPEASIDVDIRPEDLAVRADPVKVDRMLRALLRNAIGHTPTHTPITVRARPSSSGATITVEDRGPGVRDELKRTIFEPFVRGDSYLPHDPGLGLGLSLVASIATEHGGTAWVTDTPGGGAAFHVELPAADPPPASPGAEPDPGAIGS